MKLKTVNHLKESTQGFFLFNLLKVLPKADEIFAITIF